ncbi:hypothetical protein PSTG_00229 [Puccinia striiformis f. sp. tritici PST-78]|uniref:Uncharacterized protein n=1 Tax=Puccinia striiformis f. sp. tritici PST-78 TaxID=1165861 RepID=A0A0L0W474_9BASI|nr:hypothetical protein PSTG_00229 [Puccinia striiformis f. sp. tritici PST-78]
MSKSSSCSLFQVVGNAWVRKSVGFGLGQFDERPGRVQYAKLEQNTCKKVRQEMEDYRVHLAAENREREEFIQAVRNDRSGAVSSRCAYIVLFMTCLFLAVENLALGSGMPTIKVFAKENTERKKLNAALQAQMLY